MNMQNIISTSPLILAECAISERLRRSGQVDLHPTLFLTPLIYDDAGSRLMVKIYSQYRTIAEQADLPVILCAPTWRIDRLRCAEAGYDERLVFDAVQFMQRLQKRWQSRSSPIILGGLIAPKNDCYKAAEALSVEEACTFHSWQATRLAQSGIDLVIAQTIPAVSEALGIAQALSAVKLPSIISFVINRNAEVLDGTPLADAIATIDAGAAVKPIGYMVNCVYPTFLITNRQPSSVYARLIGIQANSSSMDHTQLDGSEILHQDDLKHWGENMLKLNREFGITILGGCCGTDDSYLQYLVDHIAA